MRLELNIYELGQALKNLNKEHDLDIVIKMNLSGGWMTMAGKAIIEKIPMMLAFGFNIKSNNIIDIRVQCDEVNGSLIKITGAKDRKFIVSVESARYIELASKGDGSEKIKINEKECKLKIDNDILFSIKATADEVLKI
ncbi:MAG: UDP-N-acetylglucosamine pyrophosphorylase, partial [Clostridium sp.]